MKKNILAFTLIGLFTSFASLTYATETPPAVQDPEKVLNILNWEDYMSPDMIKDFYKKTGIKINVTTFEDPDDMQEKLAKSKNSYDLIVTDASNISAMAKEGLLQSINFKNIPNAKNSWDLIDQKLKQISGASRYSMNYVWGTTGLAFDPIKAKTRLPAGTSTDSLALIFDPKIAAKFKDCGIGLVDEPKEVIPAALAYANIVPDSSRPEDLKKAEKILMAIRPYIKTFYESGEETPFATGEACLGLVWSGDLFIDKSRAQAKNKKLDVQFVFPKEGALIWFDQFAIPKAAKHKENALAFLDYFMDGVVNANSQVYLHSASGNNDSHKYLPASFLNEKSVFPDHQTMQKLYIRRPYDEKATEMIDAIWEKVKAAK